jgi:hypothetical protein
MLRRSALQGCHLCTLFVSGLDLSRPDEALRGDGLPILLATHPRSVVCDDERWQVTLRYFPYYQSVPFDHGERLEIHYGNLRVPLFLESIAKRDIEFSLRMEPDSEGGQRQVQDVLPPFQSYLQDLRMSYHSLHKL